MEWCGYRTWGRHPFSVVVIHGGPGVPGSAAPIAKELSATTGVLEPFQTKATLQGQITELHDFLEGHADLPAVLIGHSWGAWLAYLVAARHPTLARRLILVGSGPFEESYAASIMPERLIRLSESERIEIFDLMDIISEKAAGNKDMAMARFGQMCAKADTYDALLPEKEPQPLPASEEISRKVWGEAEQLRISGEILEIGRHIERPVVAVHGDYDPHPAEGVKKPLERTLRDFRFNLLEKCGHEPWRERHARERFFRLLRDEIASP